MPIPAPVRYDSVSRIFHWLTASAVIAAFILGPEHFGRQMRDGLDPATRWDIVWHESLGMLVFFTTLLRLLWVAARPATPRFDMAAWMLWASKGAHLGLWALMLLTPLTAVLALGTEGHPLTLLGGLRFNDLPWTRALPLADSVDWGDVHQFLGDAILWLAGVHAVAAIYHHVVLKDGVLAAMLPAVRGIKR